MKNYSQLIEAHLCGDLCPDDEKRLRDWILEDSAHAEIFVKECHMERCLHKIEETGVEQAVILRPVVWSRRLLALAASVLILIGLGFLFPRLIFPTIAVVENVAGEAVVDDRGQLKRLEPGMRIVSGMHLRIEKPDGAVSLEWNDGSWLTVNGIAECVLNVIDRQKRLDIVRGTVSADVEKQKPGRPFLIVAPNTRTEVLGTSLRVTVEHESVDVSVVNGNVQTERMSDGKSVLIPSRHAVKVNAGAANLEARLFYWADRFTGAPGGGVRSFSEQKQVFVKPGLENADSPSADEEGRTCDASEQGASR